MNGLTKPEYKPSQKKSTKTRKKKCILHILEHIFSESLMANMNRKVSHCGIEYTSTDTYCK